MTYYTTYEQEQELTTAVNAAVSEMALSEKADYEKIELIHDFICDSVDYDYSLTKYSAYEALCTGTAVCQGYAVLFYRMCKEAGLSVRLIAGIGNGGAHGWNIVKLGSVYYNIDCTWDGQGEETTRNWFLLSEADFVNHTRYDKYNTTQFHSTYTMSEMSYNVSEALNLDNLDYTYTTLDDSTVSSAASEKPKLLIFFRKDCYNSQSTIQSIKNDIGYFAQADIYAIEIYQNTKEDVSAFKETYGCDAIVFSYNTESTNNRSMWSYLSHSGDTSNRTTLPVICYIDADNKLQHITKSISSASAIYANLKYYCNYTYAPYTITYVLNNGINNSTNPTTYTSESETIVLADPTRNGYIFDGWYSDEQYTNKITEITKGSTGNITLYAKWKIEETGELPTVEVTANEGTSVVGISGTYYTETEDKILARLNEIRLEACKEGVKDPYTGKALTEDDYKPLKWSADLEAIARIRAAEASVHYAHTRPNGQSCFSAVTTNGIQAYGENLAWNYDGLMKGIEQFYEEKSDWVNNNTSAVTGHYESMISTRFTYVGMGAFCQKSCEWYTVAQEFCSMEEMDSRKDEAAGKCIQNIEIRNDMISSLKIASSDIYIEEEKTYTLPVELSVKLDAAYDKECEVTFKEGNIFTSADTTVAEIDSKGMITAKATGNTTITATAADKTASINVTVYEKGKTPVMLTSPAKTTYKVGESIDLKGGKISVVIDENIYESDITSSMISGFNSEKAGICTVSVSYKGYTADFDTLVVDEPSITAEYGQTLSQVTLPENEYGSYVWADKSLKLENAGANTYKASFIPKDKDKFQTLDDLEVTVNVYYTLKTDTTVTFEQSECVYNGKEQTPKVDIVVGDSTLVENEDYIVEFKNNINAGTAQAVIAGVGYYTGSIIKEFIIVPAKLTIKAKDMHIMIGSAVPKKYEYNATGLVESDKLITEPIFTCNIESTAKAGKYEIIPSGADAGANYNITYKNGTLIVADERVAYTVTFDVQGHGDAPESQVGVKAGDIITEPVNPVAEGYVFDGWYKEAECKNAWSFENDIVESDITLYAKWLKQSDNGFMLNEITDVYYTGKVCKPVVTVKDGDTLLKLNKDYKITYSNNINANKDGKLKKGDGAGKNFDENLPYVTITGKGNYTDTVKINFNILPVSIGTDENDTAAGIKLKYNDQLVSNNKKALKVFSSIKYVKAMKQDVDFTLTLEAIEAFDIEGKAVNAGKKLENASVPAGYTGSFLLTITGKGNYTGSIEKTVYVTDSKHLMKNAKITLGKNIKSVELTGDLVELTPSDKATADTFVVKCGGETLIYGSDYNVSYRNNDRVGKAELIISGKGDYAGSKTVTFQIKGKAFNAKNVTVENPTEKYFTGKAHTQNKLLVVYGKGTDNEAELVYGKDYIIKYSKNINKGNATMTFVGINEAGYSGSFKKTFKINAVDISDTQKVIRSADMKNISAPYIKAGAQPKESIVLTNASGVVLTEGKDYTVKFKNNKAVGEKSAVMVIRGKGNYTETFEVPFTITEGSLNSESIIVSAKSVAYNAKKAAEFEYKPTVTVMDGKSKLSTKDYSVEYVNNTQADYEAYIKKLEAGNAKESDMPRAVITAAENGNYTVQKPITIPLPIYLEKFTKSKLTVNVEEVLYTGTQVKPKITVAYNGTPLTEGKDYTLTYGKNNIAGRNKGTVKISGVSPYYGGDVTVKFDIKSKKVSW